MKRRNDRRMTASGRSREFPALPEEWVDDVIFELRLRDVAGARIMEILTEAEQHCVETGESPVEAFGPAETYAASFDFEGQERAAGSSLTLYIACGIAILFGFLTVTRHAGDLVAGGTATIDVGGVAAILMVVAIFGTVNLWLRAVIEGSWLIGVLGMAGWFAAYIALQVWGGPVIASPPALAVVAVGAVLLLGGALAMTHLTLRDPQDLLTRPGADAGRDRAFDRSQLIAIWILPVLAAAAVAFAWFVR